ncbi:MAG: hypothetical protein WBC83_00060 [Minisyncoccia bacterium]
MKKKQPSFIKLYRADLSAPHIKDLSDSEFRLWVILKVLAGWDPRHKEHFMVIRSSIRDLQASHLPTWKSSGKFSLTINQLIKKDMLKRMGARKIKLLNPVLQEEQGFLPEEQSVLVEENLVSQKERERVNEKLQDIKNLLATNGILRKRENNIPPKEI